MSKKTKADLERELREARKEIKRLNKRNELTWKMHIQALDQIAEMKIKEDIRFESEYEYIMSGESSLTAEEEQIYLSHNYDRYKNIKKGLKSERELLSDLPVSEDDGRTEENKEEAERIQE